MMARDDGAAEGDDEPAQSRSNGAAENISGLGRSVRALPDFARDGVHNLRGFR